MQKIAPDKVIFFFNQNVLIHVFVYKSMFWYILEAPRREAFNEYSKTCVREPPSRPTLNSG